MTIDLHEPPAAALPLPPAPPAPPRSRGRLATLWFVITGPVLALVLVWSGVYDIDHSYFSGGGKAHDLLVVDVFLVGAMCVITRWRWPAASLAVSLGVMFLASVDHTNLAVVVVPFLCLMSIAWRGRVRSTLAAYVATVGAFVAMGVVDRTDFGGAVISVALPIAVLVAIAFAAGWLTRAVRRRRGRPDGTSVSRPSVRTLGVIAAVLVIAQPGLLWTTRTLWPSAAGLSAFTTSFCLTIGTMNLSLSHDLARVAPKIAKAPTLAEKRADQLALLADEARDTEAASSDLRDLAAQQPVGSAAHSMAADFADAIDEVAHEAAALETPWSHIPLDNAAAYNATEAKLKARLDDATARFDKMKPGVTEIKGSYASQRALAHGMEMGACGLFF